MTNNEQLNQEVATQEVTEPELTLYEQYLLRRKRIL